MNSNNFDPDEEDVISKETETVQGQVTHNEGQGPSEDRLETDRLRASPPDRQSNGRFYHERKFQNLHSTFCTPNAFRMHEGQIMCKELNPLYINEFFHMV